MPELLIQIDAEPDLDLAAAVPRVDAKLSGVTGVEEAESTVREPHRIGVAELTMGLTTAVVLAGGMSQLTGHIRDTLRNIKEALQELRGIKDAYIELRGERIPLEGATDAQLEAVVASLQ